MTSQSMHVVAASRSGNREQPQAEATSGISDGARVAVGAAALLGVAALSHQSHERKSDCPNRNA